MSRPPNQPPTPPPPPRPAPPTPPSGALYFDDSWLEEILEASLTPAHRDVPPDAATGGPGKPRDGSAGVTAALTAVTACGGGSPAPAAGTGFRLPPGVALPRFDEGGRRLVGRVTLPDGTPPFPGSPPTPPPPPAPSEFASGSAVLRGRS